MTRELYLIRLSGEITTKAPQTRIQFTKRLVKNLRAGFERAGIEAAIDRRWSRIYVDAASPLAREVIGRTFGIQSYSPVERRPWKEMSDVVGTGYELFHRAVEGKRFAVRARRSGERRRIPFRSKEVERELGTALLAHARSVDLSDPEVTASIEIHEREAYYFQEKVLGPSGLPLGTEGRALSLVSGGFDSAVSSWMMLRRGVALDYVFFNLGGSAHELGVLRVMKVIAEQWSHGDRTRLYAIDFRPVVEAIQGRVTSRYWQVVLKRLMLRAAETLGRELRRTAHTALVTGEAIGQVSSQTPQNLAAISAPIELPILRPLLGFNKEEIIDRCREIGTYELSSAVDEYCAILPKRPATRAAISAVDAEEEKLDPAIVAAAIAGRTVRDLREIDPATLGAENLGLDRAGADGAIPEGACLVDLRSRAAYDAWHPRDAVHKDFFTTLKHFGDLDRDATYVLFCEVGLKSAHLAEVMQQAGYRAFHVTGGVKELLRRETENDPLAAQLLSPALLD